MEPSWLLASFRGCREIAENADADMRDREKLAFENACGVWWTTVGKVDNCGWMERDLRSASGGTEAQTASARTVGADGSKNTRFLYEIYINTFPRLAK